MQNRIKLLFIIMVLIPIGIFFHASQLSTQNIGKAILNLDEIESEKAFCQLQSRAPVLDETNLTANWRLNDGEGTTASDSSGNGHTGTIDGAEWVQGYQAQGLDLEQSSNQYINCGDNDAFTFTNGTDTFDTAFSLCAWSKFESVGSMQGIFGKYQLDHVAEREYFLRVDSANELIFNLFDHASNSYGNRLGIETDTLIEANKWYFIVATYDGSELEAGLNIYFNTTKQTVSTDSAGVYNGMGNGNTSLGLGIDGLTNELDGIIDEIRIYDKELSQAEINELYNYTISSFSEVSNGVCSVNITSSFEGSLNGEQMNYSLYLDDVLQSSYDTTSNAQGESTYALGPLRRETEYQLQVTSAHYIHTYYFTIDFETVQSKGLEPTFKILTEGIVTLGIFSLAILGGLWLIFKLFKGAIT